MSGYLVVDIRHWLDENEEPGVPQLRSKVDFLKELITYETAFEAGMESFPLPICRKRPGRKPCKSPLRTMTEETWQGVAGKVICWQCPKCKDSGMVYGWEGLMCDLSGHDFEGESFN